jgi:hypothetical protein
MTASDATAETEELRPFSFLDLSTLRTTSRAFGESPTVLELEFFFIDSSPNFLVLNQIFCKYNKFFV